MLARSKYLMLAVMALGLVSTALIANPAPEYQDLALPDGYGHVNYTFNAMTRVFTFTVFNDQVGAGRNICGFAVYPTAVLTGIVPVVDGPPPLGWVNTGWEGPITGLGPQFGNIRDAFVANLPVAQIGPGGSLNSFTLQWIGTNLPTNLNFGLEVCRPSGTFWAQEGANPCPPIPDANTLVLAATGALMALPAMRLRRRTA